MERFSRELEVPFRQFLASVVGDQERHVRFLNMLSLMEHIGSRKIMLSQMKRRAWGGDAEASGRGDAARLLLQAERRAAGRAAARGLSRDETLCRGAAAMYIGRLDAEVKRNVDAPVLQRDPVQVGVADHRASGELGLRDLSGGTGQGRKSGESEERDRRGGPASGLPWPSSSRRTATPGSRTWRG